MRFFVTFVLIVLSACSYQQLFDKLSTPAEQAQALHAVRAVQSADLQWLQSASDPRLRTQLDATLVGKMQALAKGDPVLGNINVQWQIVEGRKTTLKRFTYELGNGGKWAVFEVVLETAGPKPVIESVFVQPVGQSLIGANRFTFRDKGPIQLLWLVLIAAAVATSLVAFVLALRTRSLRFKWLWCVGVLFSFGMFQLDWTTGAWRTLPVSFLLLGGSGFQQGPFTPWIFSFAVPVIAILFLVLRATGRLPIKPAADQPIGTP
nr:hypothetical protein [uncultured Sphingomonas sp.]